MFAFSSFPIALCLLMRSTAGKKLSILSYKPMLTQTFYFNGKIILTRTLELHSAKDAEMSYCAHCPLLCLC